MRTIDLNCDLGEGAGNDEALMPLISSASIACGWHAGDRLTMQLTHELAGEHSVQPGAHPGFADPVGFGRREMALEPAAIAELVKRQVGALQEIGRVFHVKPHGALYNLASRRVDVAEAIVGAVRALDPNLVLFAASGSVLERVGRASGLAVAAEVFPDRGYGLDGLLLPRGQPGANVADEAGVARQVREILAFSRVPVAGGGSIPVRADTLCLHGDGPTAVALAHRVRAEIAAAGWRMAPFRTSGSGEKKEPA